MGGISSSFQPEQQKLSAFVQSLYDDSKSFTHMCENIKAGKLHIPELDEATYLFQVIEGAQEELHRYKTCLIKRLQERNVRIFETIKTYRPSHTEGKPDRQDRLPKHTTDSSQQQKQHGKEQLLQTIRDLQVQINHMETDIYTLKETNTLLKKEKDTLLVRLSKIAGDKLTDNNPAIADLSDSNRPTKLAEFYSELYDNEWTDAFEELKKSGYTEHECIDILKMTLKNTFDFCKKKADLLQQKASDTVNVLFEEYKEYQKQKSIHRRFTIKRSKSEDVDLAKVPEETLENIVLPFKWRPKNPLAEKQPRAVQTKMEPGPKLQIDLEHKLTKLRKEVALSMVSAVQKAYLRASWSPDCIPELKPYIKQCLFIGWMMVLHSPQLCFSQDPEPGAPLDHNLYKPYVTNGRTIKYLVWPAMLLHENGPLLLKGVAEGRKENKS